MRKSIKTYLKANETALFLRKLALVLDAGVTITGALSFLIRQTKNRRLNTVLIEMHGDILKGLSLSDSMKKHCEFTSFMVSMVRIGEVTGRLPLQLIKTADYYDKELKLKNDIVSSLSYPAFIGVLMTFLIIISVVFVVPNYMNMFSINNIALPLPTKILIAVSDFFTKYYFFIFLFIFAAAAGIICFLKTHKGRLLFDGLCLKTPLIKTLILKSFNLRLAESLCILISSGVNIIDSMEIIKNNVSGYPIKKHMEDVILMLAEGERFTDCIINCDYYDPLFKDLSAVGEETGNLEKTMEKCAEYLNGETERYIKHISKFLEPAVIIILGAVLGLIMLAVTMPSFSLIDMI